MSLDGLRDAFSREKKSEIANCELSRKRKLRELYNYTALLNASHPPSQTDWLISDEPGADERRFLDENDITKGFRFNDSTLPFPTIQHATISPSLAAKSVHSALPKASPAPVASAYLSFEDQLRAASASPSVAAHPLPSVETPAPKDSGHGAKRRSTTPQVDAPFLTEAHAIVASQETKPKHEAQQQIVAQPSTAPAVQEEEIRRENVPDGPAADPQDVVMPTSEDVAVLPETAVPETAVERKPRAPQVVHLPPREVQEARLRETERKLEKTSEKESKEEERLGLPTSNAPMDLISSPSSTVGPYSQATPHAPHHSPDTSPDTESFRDRVPRPVQNELLDPAAQQAKDEHDRALERRMREARERARASSSPTPEIEKQIEAEQAIRLVRDGKSRLSESDAQPRPGTGALTQRAEDVVEEVEEAEVSSEQTVEGKPAQVPVIDSLPTPTTTAPESSNLDPDGTDNIPSKPREVAPMTSEHLTPPAENDVEMEDAQLSVKEEKNAGPHPQLTRPERMTTRVSSGAIRQKSVSEIIGEKSASKAVLTPRSSNLSSVSPPRPRSSDHRGKEVSTVIFAKPGSDRTSKALQQYSEDYAALQGASQDSTRDYLQLLFQWQAHHPPRSAPLQELLASARKTVSTAGTLAAIREAQDYKILKRVYQLQNANRWSLRQILKSAEPPRPATHLDHLLAEMKWMQTDFKEERKWKKALASTFADWCAEYVNSSPVVQASLRVRARVPRHARRMSTADDDMTDAPTPDLVPSGANETESESFPDDEELLPAFGSNAPAVLFALGFNDVVMKINRTPASDEMFHELPAYDPTITSWSDVTPASFCEPPILPVSKFVTGKLVSTVRGPPRKRSRYEYDSEDEPSRPTSRSGTSAEHSMPSTPGRRLYHRNDLQPEMDNVALFNPENKHVRDRLQAAHQFRPPTEFVMPSVGFFENRNSSQWLWDEDQKLRSLVKEYTFNWSLVAQELAMPSLYISGAGRRTPWECFERWVQLEGLPTDMSKTPYFRTYQTRLEQAQRTVMAQQQAQQQLLQQQAQQGQNVPAQIRRRTTQPIRVERRRDNRHLAMIDGMRKLARKRESAAHKQAEAQKAAALRKAHEPAQPKTNIHTPQEFSRLKWEREEKLRQQAQLKHDLHMRQAMAAAQAQRQASMQGQSGVPNGVNQAQRNGTPGNANVPVPMANSSSQSGHPNANAAAMAARAMPGQPGMPGNFPNGNMAGMGMGQSGIPQAQMQANMQNTQRMAPPDNMRMGMPNGQFSTSQQHQYQLQQQQQQINMASNLTASMNMGGIMPNANMIAAMARQNMNGTMNASMNGMAGNASSPRTGQVNTNMQSPARPLSSGHMPQLLQIQNSLKAQHPDWTQEQLQKVASDTLSKHLARQRAMNAASGASGLSASPQVGSNVYLQNNGIANSPSPNTVQNYQAQLVQQQRMMSQQQRQGGSPSAMNAARPPSRSATPQNPQLQQSPGMQQAQLSRN